MNQIARLQDWYKLQCDGDWEHHHGISIASCDNPGWWVKVDLAGTSLEGKPFDPVARNVSLQQMERVADGVEPDIGDRGPDWMLCEVKDDVFSGAGDPDKLRPIVATFLTWAEGAGSKQPHAPNAALRRFLLTCSVLFLVALAWNAFLHLVVLSDANASVLYLRRPDLAEKAWLSVLLAAGIVTAFVWGYGRFARSGSLCEGLGYGLFFALLAGLLVDLNQYVLFPIPAVVAAQWFLGGLIEFGLYGIIAARFYPPRRR